MTLNGHEAGNGGYSQGGNLIAVEPVPYSTQSCSESSRCQKKDAATSTAGSEIQWTLGLFDGSTLYGVGRYHGGPDIRVSEQFLNSAYIIIGLQEMGGKAVAEGRGGYTFQELCLPDRRPDRLLPVRFVPMISPVLPLNWNESQRLGRKEPLPDQFPWGGRIFLFEQTIQEYARVPCRNVLVMEFHHPLKLRLQCRQNRLWDGNGPVLLPLAVVDGEDSGVEIEMMQAQLQTFEQAETAAIQQLDHQVIGRREMLQHGINFLPGEHNRDVSRAPRPGNVPVVAVILLQKM